MQLRPLDAYDVTHERGFLCKHDAARVVLPDSLSHIRELALSLPARIVAGRVRRDLDTLLPVANDVLDAITDETVLRAALVHYSFLAQAYVWSEPTAPASLPAGIARPLWRLAFR